MEGLVDCQIVITAKEAIALAIAVGSVGSVLMALLGRLRQDKGIGWQFIRFTAIALALPLTAVLALTNTLTEATAAILAGSLGYAFGRPSDGGPDA